MPLRVASKFGMGQTFFVCFCPYLNTMTNLPSTKFDFKSIDGVLGIRTRDCSMVGVDDSTELWLSQRVTSMLEHVLGKSLFYYNRVQCDQIGRFLHLGQQFKAFGNKKFAQISYILS